ncbi:MAG: hypothetical protein AAGF45_08930 [Pseudomonadota bacterium]
MATIILFGCGAVGSRLLRALEQDYGVIEVVGAVDHAPQKTGRTLGEVCGTKRFSHVPVAADLSTCLAALEGTPDLLVHMTESKVDRIEGQLTSALKAGMNVVSAAESMFYPWLRYPEFSARLNACAHLAGRTITGMGINPGFSYDALPLLLARSTSAVTGVRIQRTIDVTGTGPGDIEHVGYGLTPEEFYAGVTRGDIVGHMGGPESLALMAQYLGIALDEVQERWDLETAAFPVDSGDPTLGTIAPGRVVGIRQHAEARSAGEIVLSTQLSMYYQPERFGLTECDEIQIEGAMPVRVRIEPAIETLFGAANMLASSIVPTVNAAPGLRNALEMPIVGERVSWRHTLDTRRPLEPGRVPLRTDPA